MPDPGMADLPPLAPGQREYNAMLANTDQATADAWKRDQAMQLLKSGKFSPNDVNAYFGEQPAKPSPAAHDAAAGNTDRAVQANGGDNAFLADPAHAALTSIGFDQKGVDWYLSSVRAEQQRDDQGYRASQGSFSSAFSGKDGVVGTAADAAMGVMDFAGAGFQHAVSAVTGPLYEGVAKPLYTAVPEVGQAVGVVSKVNQVASQIMFGPAVGKLLAPLADPTDPHALTDAVGGIMLMAGGPHFGETAKVPEGARALAVDGMRDGTLRDPVDLMHTSGHDPTPMPDLVRAMPATQDFTTAVEQLGGAKVWSDPIAKTGLTPSGQRILKNLQEVYANTGRGPQDVAEQAAHDPAFADELVQQDMFGSAATPKFNASAPKPPPGAGVPPREPTAVAQGPLAQAASETAVKTPSGTFINSPERAQSIMAQLEASPDIHGRAQVSRTGAVGQYQIEPGTARQYGFDPAKLGDPAYNQMVGHAIIGKLYEKFHGNMEAMSIAYNDGPGRAQQWLNAGKGWRLEAELDPTTRNGWKYVKVAADRDESFMPLETQQYVARARFKMNGKEPTPAPGAEPGASPAEWVQDEKVAAENEQAAREAQDAEVSAEAEGRIESDETIMSKSLSAANAYEGMTTDERTAEAMRAIGEQPAEQEGLFDRLKTPEGRAGLKSDADQWVATRLNHWVSDLDQAKRIDTRLQRSGTLDPKTQLSVEDAFRNTKSSDDRAEHMLTRGRIEGNMTTGEVRVTEEGGTVPRVLQAILDAGSDTDRFHARLLAERTLNRLTLAGKRAKAAGKPFSKGIADAPPTPIPSPLAYQIMHDPEMAKLDPAIELWKQMHEAKLQYAVENGMLSPSGKETLMEADPVWMSWQKLAGEPDRPVGASGYSVRQSIVKMGAGHSDQVVNAFDGLWKDTALITKNADRNAARQFGRAMIEADPETALHYGWRKISKIDPNEDIVDKALREAGVDPDEITDKMREAAAPTVALRAERDLPQNHFYIWDEGKPTEYAVDSPEIGGLFRGANSTAEISGVWRSMAGVAKFERGLQIANPEFAGRVLGVMHPFQTFIFDKSVPHHFPLEEFFKGWGDAMGHTDLYEQAKAHGAFADWADQVDKRWVDAQTLSASNVQAGERMNQPGTKEWDFQAGGVHGEGKIEIGNAFDGKRNVIRDPVQFAQHVWNSYKSPAQWSQAGRDLMSQMSEINRMGGYKMALEQGYPPAKAAAIARKMFLDFQEHATGELAQRLNSITNYQRAHILGTKQVFEAFTTGGNVRDTMVKTFAGIMIPTAGLQALAMLQDSSLPENERYTNIEQWKKDSMFITPQLPWGGRLMIPFPWGVTPVMMMQQRVLEGAFGGLFGDKASKAKWGDGTFWIDFAKTLVPPLIPSAVEPVADVITNHSWSSGHPLNSDAVMSRLPADRYTYNTSLVGRLLGKYLAPVTAGTFAPTNIDHMIDGYLGPPGMGALKAVDGVYHAATNTGRPLDMGDIPVVNWIVHTADGFSGKHIDDFYSQYQDFQNEKGSFSFYKEIAKGGTPGAMDNTDVDPAKVQAVHALGRISGMLAMDRSIAYAVENNSAMPASEKSSALKALYAHAVVASIYGTTFMDTVSDQSLTQEQKERVVDTVQQKMMPRLQELERQFPHAG